MEPECRCPGGASHAVFTGKLPVTVAAAAAQPGPGSDQESHGVPGPLRLLRVPPPPGRHPPAGRRAEFESPGRVGPGESPPAIYQVT